MTIKITGDFEHIDRFYNRTLRSSYFTTQMVDGNYYSNMIYHAATPLAAVAVVDSLAQIEIDQINHYRGGSMLKIRRFKRRIRR